MKFDLNNILSNLTLDEREEALNGIQELERTLSLVSADDIVAMIISLLGDEDEQRDT
jgi:hypothetical protein